MATFKNNATGETYRLGIELTAGESMLSAAWGRGLRAVCQVKNWNRYDVAVVATSNN